MTVASLPLPAMADGIIFEAELIAPVVERTGSMTVATDAGACENAALEAPSVPNAVSYTITFLQSGDRYVWLRVLQPPGTTRTILVTLDGGTPPAFQSPQESFDIVRGAACGYIWERVTLRGSGSPGSPDEDPRVFSIITGDHDLDLAMVDADVRIDRVGITTRIDFVPNNCAKYPDPPDSDGGGEDGGSGGEDGGSGGQDGGSGGQDGGSSCGDSGGPPPGDAGSIDGAISAGCEPGEYFDLLDATCRKPGDPARCASVSAPWWGAVSWLAYRRRQRKRRLR